MKKFLLIGAGKVAKHLHYYLSALGPAPLSWDRAQDPHLLKTKIAEASHILLAISDSGLEPFFRSNLAGYEKVVVHFSGALSVDGVIAAHPLMSFGPELYSLETYQKIHFVVTGARDLSDALPGVANTFSVLPADAKPFYHALCVMGGNFPVILWQKMFAEFTTLGIPADAAGLYLETVLRNTLQKPDSALTGPLARRDRGTVEKNIQALEGDKFQALYRAFVDVVAPDLLNAPDSPTLKERP